MSRMKDIPVVCKFLGVMALLCAGFIILNIMGVYIHDMDKSPDVDGRINGFTPAQLEIEEPTDLCPSCFPEEKGGGGNNGKDGGGGNGSPGGGKGRH